MWQKKCMGSGDNLSLKKILNKTLNQEQAMYSPELDASDVFFFDTHKHTHLTDLIWMPMTCGAWGEFFY